MAAWREEGAPPPPPETLPLPPFCSKRGISAPQSRSVRLLESMSRPSLGQEEAIWEEAPGFSVGETPVVK